MRKYIPHHGNLPTRDNEGNLTSATNADGNQIGAEYDDDMIDLLSYTNIVGEKFTYSYHADIDHVLAGIMKSDGNGSYLHTSYEYDAYGNVEKAILVGTDGTDSTGNITTETTYDSYGRVQSVIDSLGKTTTYNRNSATELLNYVTDANENRTAYSYDSKERLIGIFNDKDADGVVDTNEENVVYTYNDKDQLTSINNGSTTYTFTYDSYGNVTTIKAGTYTLASYTYNEGNGKLLSTAYGNGLTVTNVYDSLDRLVESKYNNVVAYTVSYNGDGAISKVVDNRSGITAEYEYDSLGRLIFAIEYETSSKTVVLQTENKYDSFGRPLGSSYDLPDIDIGYSVDYKDNSNLIESFLQHNSSDMELNGKFYTYDALERLTGVRVVMDGLTVYNESYTYVSDNGRTSSLVATHTVDGVVYSYTYDDVGNITSVSENGTLRASYYYDSLGQLGQASYYSDRYYSEGYYDAYEYFYDKSGNITVKRHHYGIDAAYSDSVTYTYDNDAWGDLLTNYNGTAISYDAIGNPLNWRNAADIEWYGRQLSLFAHTDGTITTYGYNADGIRTSKYFYDASGYATGTVKYTLDGSTIVAENRNGTNIYYTYDDKGAIMGMIYGGETYMFSKNLQGDVIGIYNESGILVAKYEYSAFGEITSVTDLNGSDIANINPFRYRGYYYDTDTGFYYLMTRYYDPEVGRFLNADAFVSTGQGLIGNNMFAYCLNNPVDGYDPLGMCGVCDSGAYGPCSDLAKSNQSKKEDKNNNFSFSLYDSDRFEDKTPFHEEFFTISGSGPSFDLSSGDIWLGGIEGDVLTGGWETKYVDVNPFNFGHAEAGFGIEDGEVNVGAIASIWSPDVAIKTDDYEVGIGAEIGSVGFSFNWLGSGFKVKASLLFGIEFSLSW